ncbi:MAG TPA: GNAT family N-acetyltransferase [Streptosporangiaceae bacterium]|jgi:ribosomal protein S18 acetylase RimI-like enzyme
MGNVMIREARPGELAAVGDLRVAAYAAGGFLSPGYAPELRALGTQGDGTVLVADPGDAGPIAGTIMLVTWPTAGELISGPDEAEIRALAVAPGGQHGGVGTGLLLTVLNWAELAGAKRVVLSTLPEMRAAHRLYERNGFVRLPDRDWSPRADVRLLAYILELGTAEGDARPGT